MKRLTRRAELFREIRHYFDEEAVLEVDPPIMSGYGNPDPALLNFTSDYHGSGIYFNHTMYLTTSPEYRMKCLLAEGSGSIYYLGKVFRDGELSRKHTPEFTMLEWYRVGYDLSMLIDEVVTIIQRLSKQHIQVHRTSYRDLFLSQLKIDPFICDQKMLASTLKEHDVALAFVPKHKDEYLDLLMTHLIEPNLPKDQITVLHSYPASQASLAKIEKDPHNNLIGKRFEVYWKGLELANGYEELTQSEEQRKRFESENMIRQSYGYAPVRIDEFLLAHLDRMPPLCSGVALGIDRLLMAIYDVDNIDDVLSFKFEDS